jgi:DNA-binding CsgD family transcriptional regulator
MVTTSVLVDDAYAGTVLLERSGCEPLPELPGHELFDSGCPLLDTVRGRRIEGELHLTFLWPTGGAADSPPHVRVSYLAFTEPPRSRRLGVVLLSPVRVDHGLTHRELEVLGLLVDGCSNQQIAEGLVVTPRTVATHVEHILVKLASPTRTHAAVLAHREGLYVPASGSRAV